MSASWKSRLREAGKPGWPDLAATLLVYVGLPVVRNRVQVVCASGFECGPVIAHDSLLSLVFASTGELLWSWRPVWALLLAFAGAWAVLTAWRSIDPATRGRFRAALAPDRTAWIVAAVGWTTLPSIVMHYRSGQVGGLTGMSGGERTLYGIAEALGAFPLPWGALTWLVLWPLSLNLWTAYLGMARLSELGPATGPYPESLTGPGLVLVLATCALAWMGIGLGVSALWARARSSAGS